MHNAMDEGSRFLILSLEGGRFAIPTTSLLEITMPRDIRKDANLTTVFEGKFEYRGRLIPVLNVKKMLRLTGQPGGVLLVIKGVKGILGILVDAVTEIVDADQKPIPLPPGVMDPSLRYYSGILRHRGELILLLSENGILQ
jgi:chemotaxis signal transduction protein